MIAGSDDAHVYAWHADGTPVAGWPKSTGLAVMGVPVVVPLNSGARSSVIIGDFGGNFYTLDMSQRLYLPIGLR